MTGFGELAGLFAELEETTSHKEIVRLLSSFFKELDKGEVRNSAYLALGSIGPMFEDTTLGIGDRLAIKALSRAYDAPTGEVEKRYSELGDLGDVAFELDKKKKSSLAIKDVFKQIVEIKKAAGKGSQEEKINLLSELLSRATPEEGKYIVRIVLGKLRLGFGDQFLLEAFSNAFTGDKKYATKVKESYSICTDIGELAESLSENGTRSLGHFSVKPGRPVKSMLAQRVKRFEELEKRIPGKKAVEEKYDGERVQVHVNGKEIRAFSRRLEDISSQFPDVIEAVRESVRAEKIVLDGEIVAYMEKKEEEEEEEEEEKESEEEEKGEEARKSLDGAGEFLPFQKLMQRRRKYDVGKYAEMCPVAVFFFDILYLDGKALLKKPYPERRSLLEEHVKESGSIRLARRIVTEELEEIEDFFNRKLEEGLEGIVVKATDSNSIYEAGKRSWLWLKWKGEYAEGMRETFDLVVVGSYYGKGKRKGSFGALLCAALNEEEQHFETFTKVGTGFTDADAEEINSLLSKHTLEKVPKNVLVKKGMLPDTFIEPAVVVEVLGSEITESPGHTAGIGRGEEEGEEEKEEGRKEKGLALRFPRFLRIRYDKGPYDATKVREIMDLRRT